MTTSLFLMRSKTRSALLAFLLEHPEKEFYLRELARRIDFPAGNVRREILRLEGEGILTSRNVANLRYFKLNQKHPLFPEVQGIIYKTVGMVSRLKAALQGVGGLRISFIYGSFAKGKETGSSDLDLILIGNLRKRSEGLLDHRLRQLEKTFLREINESIFTPQDFAKKAHDPASFLSEVIRQKKIFLIGDEKQLRKLTQKMA